MEVEAWLPRAARTAPGRAAVVTPSGSCTYAQLFERAQAGAAELSEQGVAAGERVAIALPPGQAFAEALHACLLLGAVAVPLDLRLATAERDRIVAGCALEVTEPLAGVQPASGPFAHDLDATAVVIHTSGTTASPRPVELSYGNLLWSALGSAVALGLDPRERWLCTLPLSHVGGLSILVRSCIYASTAVVHERFETERALHALQHEDVTLVSVVANTLTRLLDAGLEDPPALRAALAGGGPVPASLLERAAKAGVPVSLTYGLTETSSQVTTTPVAEIERERAAPRGGALFCTRVVTAEDGEILVKGPTVARSATRDERGWLHTGDLGALDAHGRLSVTGRKADTIISGGENVAPAEVEAVLEAHPSIGEAAVIGRADERWGEAVTAIVVSRPGSPEPAEEELRAHCASALAPYKVPKAFVLRGEPLPRTASGKLLRRELA
jgi:O-succinylbenzoic acid--CoA ligase